MNGCSRGFWVRQMKVTRLAKPAVSIALASCAFFAPALIRAQAPEGPMPRAESKDAPPATAKPSTPPAEARTTILGPWKLNRDESDSPPKRTQNGRGSGGGGYGGGRGMGGGRGGYGRRGGESDEERQKMRELFSPPTTITFSMTGAEVDLVDDQIGRASCRERV